MKLQAPDRIVRSEHGSKVSHNMAFEKSVIILMCLGACAKAENPMNGQRYSLAFDAEAVRAASQFALGVEDGLSSSKDTNGAGSAMGGPHVVTSCSFKL